MTQARVEAFHHSFIAGFIGIGRKTKSEKTKTRVIARFTVRRCAIRTLQLAIALVLLCLFAVDFFDKSLIAQANANNGKTSIFADSLKHADYAKHNLLRLLAESINPPRIFNLSLEDLSLLSIAIRTQEKSFHYYETFFLLLAPFLWGRKFATSKRDGAKKKFHLNAKPFFRGRIRFKALGRDLQSVALEARAGGVVQSGYEAFGDMNQIPRKSGGIPASRWICDSHRSSWDAWTGRDFVE